MPYKHIDGVEVSAQFSKNYRYRLEIVLPKTIKGKTVCVVMQNPSCANETTADKSVKVMEKVVFLKELFEFRDVKRLIVVNQFAYIETNKFKGRDDQIGVDNDRVIEKTLKDADIIVLAWGSGNRFKKRQEFVINLLKQLKGKKIYKTKMHPSRVRYDGFIEPYLIT